MLDRHAWLAIQTPILCFLCSGILLAADADDLVPARPATLSHSADKLELRNAPTRTLHLQNNAWAQVRVEIRAGSATSCDSLGSLGVHVLEQGQEWEVRIDDPVICWRRDLTPGNPASAWTSWYRAELTSGENRVVTL